MCGIGGIFLTQQAESYMRSYAESLTESPEVNTATNSKNPSLPFSLSNMFNALKHRGPNGARTLVLPHAVLLHTRLSLIDLEGGDQPFSWGKTSLVANGEIYNDLSLRQHFNTAPFITQSDCESILAAWQHDGVNFPRHLRGMYALALYDSARQTAFLSCDPFGIKPLYYTLFEHGVAFASELAALLAGHFAPRTIDLARLSELLQLQFTTGAQSIFPSIQRVLPGETITITQGVITARSTRPALPSLKKTDFFTSENEALTAFDTAFMESIALHQRTEVPSGVFLSGGIDSACLLTAFVRHKQDAPHYTPLRCYTAVFDTPNTKSESKAAQALAHAAKIEHETISITRSMVWQHLPAIVACMDDPVADYAIIPTWFLTRHASREVGVIFSGEGGDELFCGYGRYRAAIRPWWLGRKRPWRRGIFDRLGLLRLPTPFWRAGIDHAEALYGIHGKNTSQNHAETFFDQGVTSPLARFQAVDCAEWLPHDLLLKLDRCLMAHGVEGRTPFLDPVVARVACRLPDNMRHRHGKGKWLLRQWLAEHNPTARPFAPKQGFTVPIGRWIKEESRSLAELLPKQECIAEIANPDAVKSLLRSLRKPRETAAAWNLLFYALWHRAHIRALPPVEPLFEALQT